jgi:hypothetical protein
MFIALGAARLVSQSPVDSAQGKPTAPDPRGGLTSELAERIAGAIAPAGQVSLQVPQEDLALRDAILNRFAALAIRVVDTGDGVPAIRASCIDNLREHVCAAEIAAAARTAIIVTRPHDSASRASGPGVALELRPVLSQRTRVLDLARTDDGILVLSPVALDLYKEIAGTWRSVESRPLVPAHPWPRDVRGRLRVAAGKVEAFLPGTTCTGSADPLSIACAEGLAPWPLDIQNVALDPARNYFRTPEGLPFYGIARLSDDAGARWVAATIDHTLTFVDVDGLSSATTVNGDDVVALRAACSSRSYVVAASVAQGRDGDLLTLFEVARRRLAPAASLVPTGKITALWSPPEADAATVITYDRDADRYDAHELAVTCFR